MSISYLVVVCRSTHHFPSSVEASGKVHNAVQAIIESRLGYVHRFNPIRRFFPSSVAVNPPFAPSHCKHSIRTDFISPPYMHGNLRIVICPRTRLRHHADPPRPSYSVKAKTPPQTKANPIYKMRTSKSI